jgi:hypothetical protein
MQYQLVTKGNRYVAIQIDVKAWGLPFLVRWGRYDYDQNYYFQFKFLCFGVCVASRYYI